MFMIGHKLARATFPTKSYQILQQPIATEGI